MNTIFIKNRNYTQLLLKITQLFQNLDLIQINQDA
jgi:hypothetical protein